MPNACPDCKGFNLVKSELNSILSYCQDCEDHVIPIQLKDERSKNYKERNPRLFSSLNNSRASGIGNKEKKEKRPRKSLNQFSKKQRRKNEAYRKSESDQIPKINACAKCGTTENLTRHHPYGRSGKTEDGRDCIEVWFYLCTSFGNRCHDWVHENPSIAMEQGWLQPEYRNQIRQPNHPKPWRK